MVTRQEIHENPKAGQLFPTDTTISRPCYLSFSKCPTWQIYALALALYASWKLQKRSLVAAGLVWSFLCILKTSWNPNISVKMYKYQGSICIIENHSVQGDALWWPLDVKHQMQGPCFILLCNRICNPQIMRSLMATINKHQMQHVGSIGTLSWHVLATWVPVARCSL